MVLTPHWTGLLRSHTAVVGFPTSWAEVNKHPDAAVQTERILCGSVGSESVLVRVHAGRMLSLCAGEPVPLTLHQDRVDGNIQTSEESQS